VYTGKRMREQIVEVLWGYDSDRSGLIPILQDIQDVLGYIPPEAIEATADHLGIAESAVYGVVTFYSQFYLTRQGRHRIKVCEGTACHVRGGHKIMDALTDRLGIKAGETTEDYKISLERVACFGSCALGPVLVVDEDVHGRVTEKTLDGILKALK